jgi:osmotically-inducible protein OsmY
MYKQLRTLALVSAIALSLITVSGSAFADSAQDITNARQESRISTSYALSPYLRAHEINVVVDNGKATLTGKVDEDVNKDLAQQIALGVDGIKEVDNQLVVVGDYMPPPRTEDRSFGDVVDDASITAAIKNKLLWSKYTSALTTDVDTKWGRVQLKGTAHTADAKAYAGTLARNTRGVRSVDNQLVVDLAPSKVETSAAQDVADGWITTKIKSSYMYSDRVDGSDIEVQTTDGHVLLRGKVNSGEEHALAIQIAENVRGAKDVNSGGLTHAN